MKKFDLQKVDVSWGYDLPFYALINKLFKR